MLLKWKYLERYFANKIDTNRRKRQRIKKETKKVKKNEYRWRKKPDKIKIHSNDF